MKKLLAMLCVLTCIFGLTACGNETSVSNSDQSKAEMAKVISTNIIIPYMTGFEDDQVADSYLAEYNKEEMKHIAESAFYNFVSSYMSDTGIGYIYVDGSALLSGITSFNSGFDAIGELQEIGEASAEISEDEIVVTVPVKGSLKDATAELIYSNDIFLTLEAAALNPNDTFKEAMTKAGLNTLLGMGTVFAVLIIIILFISAMGIIPKLQARQNNKGQGAAEKPAKAKPAAPAAKPAVQAAPAAQSPELVGDLELAAVIAAAIAAYEGAASTDGFVVRSIRKVRR